MSAHSRKTYEICLPNKTWKKCALPCYSGIAELTVHLGIDHGFDGNAYDLVHRGTVLDKSHQLQHYSSSIPNNGRLELVPMARKLGEQTILAAGIDQSSIRVANVKVAIDVEVPNAEEMGFEGGRMIKDVPSSYSLWQCLLHPSVPPTPLAVKIGEKLVGTNPELLYPQIVYFRHVITGISALSSTTLQQLNVHSGSARVQLRFVASDQVEVCPLNPLPCYVKKDESLPKKQKMSPPNPPTSEWPEKNLAWLPPTPTHVPPPNVAAAARRNVENIVSPIGGSIGSGSRGQAGPSTSTSSFPYEPPDPDVRRQAVHYHLLPQTSAPPASYPSSPALEDSFFEVTLDDVRSMQRDLTRKRVALENEPLKTAAMMEAEERDKIGRYPRTLIRVELLRGSTTVPRLVLQAIFGTTESLGDLYAFARHELGRSSSTPAPHSHHLKLFTAPPKKVLPDTEATTLLGAQLYPCAKVYMSCDGDSLGPPSSVRAPLVSQTQADASLATFYQSMLKTCSSSL